MKITADWPQSFEFACHSAACAPPPAGRGGSDRRQVARYPATERRVTSQQQHAALIQKIRITHERALAKNRVLRAAAKKLAAVS